MKLLHALFTVTITALLAAGCATIPEPLAGEYPATTPDQADDSHVGQNVRWGGRIVDTRPGTDETCIEILARPLDSKARPSDSDRHHGRFLACREGFEDPAIFEEGRDITANSRLTGSLEGNHGGVPYDYRRISA